MKKYNAIVVGAGHAGVEAAFALANKNHKVALVSLCIDRVAMMPCNPAIGGPAKGILTREIDALGGVQGFFADQAMIQIKMLNQSRGPAVRALRAQIDKEKYSKIIKKAIIEHENITFISGVAEKLLHERNQITGIKMENGEILSSEIVIVTTGTYMDSSILRGSEKKSSGPDGQRTTKGLSKSLKEIGLELQRLKTGTPPRVFTDSIDFSQVEKEQIPDSNLSFSNRSGVKLNEQISCYLTYTNSKTHDIINKNLEKSSMYSGQINGIGPRYCPSIEDKIVRFASKDRHQIFYEPETKKGDIIYVQGFSTSMPIEVQDQMLRTLPGMKNARVQKWAYAIEYDAINPKELKKSLEIKKINGLFMAGQTNGTSGYEEAAAQGIIAGINAALKLEKKEPLIINRDQAYIGVLIDDLVTKGTKEPYRMLTSRAEYRLLLRNDNSDQRLSHIGNAVGLVSDYDYQKIVEKYKSIENEKNRLSKIFVSSKSDLAKKYKIENGVSMLQLLSRPDVDIKDVSDFKFIYELSVHTRLNGYIKKQKTEAKKMYRLEKLKIPTSINYEEVKNLATEAKQKLQEIKPETIGQATRISGINPADIQMLMFHLEFKKR